MSSTQVERFHQEIKDAQMLLEFAVETGKAVQDKLVIAIKTAEGLLQSSELPPTEARSTFEMAYRDLAQAMAPVTAVTLKATSDSCGRSALILAPRKPVSEAKLWSRKLWLYTIVMAVVALTVENYIDIQQEFYAPDEDTTEAMLFWVQVGMILQSLIPFVYGGLGAVTYLLRSAHDHIYARTFDPNHMPKYYNRILLGVVGGGAIQLFVSQVGGEGDATVRLGADALGFLAGYNSDFLFSAIERVSAALLPKVGIDSVRKADAPKITGLSLNDLLDQLNRATDPDVKKTIQDLIAKIKERL